MRKGRVSWRERILLGLGLAAAGVLDYAPSRVAASQPFHAVYPVRMAGAGASSAPACGAPAIDVAALDAGQARIAVASDCRAGELIFIAYSGAMFIERLDAAGKLDFVLDCFAGPATVTISFSDKSEYSRELHPRDLDRITKVTIVWVEQVALDLHAFEYAAVSSETGHVWSGNPRSLAQAQALVSETGRSHGYLSTVSSGSEVGVNMEVYTLWHQPGQADGSIRLTVDYVSRGSRPQGEFCSEGRLSELRFDVYILNRGEKVRRIQRGFSAVPCGEVISDASRFTAKLIPDLVFGK